VEGLGLSPVGQLLGPGSSSMMGPPHSLPRQIQRAGGKDPQSRSRAPGHIGVTDRAMSTLN
jgi:hypothetical protein